MCVCVCVRERERDNTGRQRHYLHGHTPHSIVKIKERTIRPQNDGGIFNFKPWTVVNIKEVFLLNGEK